MAVFAERHRKKSILAEFCRFEDSLDLKPMERVFLLLHFCSNSLFRFVTYCKLDRFYPSALMKNDRGLLVKMIRVGARPIDPVFGARQIRY